MRAHDHAALIYNDETELRRNLGAFLKHAASGPRMCLFVHASEPGQRARHVAQTSNPAAFKKLEGRGLLVIQHARDAFNGGRDDVPIDYEHVRAGVDGLVALADEKSARGVRIFVDASHDYFAHGRVDEWFSFESWLGRRLHQRAGLVCAYRRSDLVRLALLERVVETHAYRYENT